MSDKNPQRRELKSRSIQLFHTIASNFARVGISPDAISIASIFFSLIFFIIAYNHHELPYNLSIHNFIFWSILIICVQLRLFCNLLDGLVAIEYGKKSRHGEFMNDFPDRIADALIIAGYAMVFDRLVLGLVVVILSIMTAYVRLLTCILTKNMLFNGPMAKQHRMFLLSLSCFVSIFFTSNINILKTLHNCTLYILIAGLLLTIINRVRICFQTLYAVNQ